MFNIIIQINISLTKLKIILQYKIFIFYKVSYVKCKKCFGLKN